MKVEVQISAEKSGTVNIESNGTSVSVNGFSASIRQLEVASMENAGLNTDQMADVLEISPNTVKDTLKRFQTRNTTGFEDVPPSVPRLIAQANQNELLFPITLIGIETVASKAEKVKETEKPTQVKKPRQVGYTPKDYVHLPGVFSSSSYVSFAEQYLDGWIARSGISAGRGLEVKRLMRSALNGQIVTKEEIERAGMSIRDFSRKIRGITLSFRDQQNQRWVQRRHQRKSER